jgi:hypothetical protein
MGLRMGQAAQGVWRATARLPVAAGHACGCGCGLQCLAGRFMLGDRDCEGPGDAPVPL